MSVSKRGTAGTWIDLGNSALLPGLVNAHTHLELSLFQQPFGTAGQSFSTWLRQMISWRRQQAGVPAQEQLTLAQGLQESESAGAALLGDIATPPSAEAWSHFSGLPHVRFVELLGLSPDRVAPLTALAEEFTRVPRGEGRLGLSPHAPYTVHPQLLERAVALSAERRFPLAMHLAESREELQLLAAQTGPLVELLQSLDAWYPQSLLRGCRPLNYLQTLAKAHRAIIAHGNYLQADEIDYLAERRDLMSIVYCPRTQAYFDHDPYPLAQFLAAGARVAIGTDSRASNPDLSIWNELRFVREAFPTIAPAEILRMGTLAGAEALGMDRDFGSIAPGKIAALAVVDLPADNAEPYEALFAGHSARGAKLP